MSVLSDMLINHRVRLILPLAGEFIYSDIGDKDVAICATITTGYLECDNKDTLEVFLKYLVSATKLKDIGGFDKVKCKAGLVYRQRIVFSKLADIVSICAKFDVSIIVPDSFKVTEENLRGIKDDLPFLEDYFHFQSSCVIDLGFYGWLTYAVVSQLVQFCRGENALIFTAKNEEILCVGGLWYRAPFLCGTSSRNSKRASLLVLSESHYLIQDNACDCIVSLIDVPIDTLNNEEKQRYSSYKIKFSSSVLIMYGFSKRNLLRDIKRGVISNEN